MKRIIFFVSLGVFLLPFNSSAQTGEWTIRDFSTEIKVQKDGWVRIEETISADFQNIEKHGIFRVIPRTYTREDGSKLHTDIDVLRIERDGFAENHTKSIEGDNLVLKIGDPKVVIRGEHSYRIAYLVNGILKNFGEYDELYWNATGNSWEVPIEKASASVVIDGAKTVRVACYEGVRGSKMQCVSKNEMQGGYLFETSNLPLFGGLTVAVGYEAGIIPINIVEAQWADKIRELSWGYGFFPILFLGIIVLAWLWNAKCRDYWWVGQGRFDPNKKERKMPLFAHETIVPEYDPPLGMKPAEIGVLMDGRFDKKDIAATVVDLAIRGYLRIEEAKDRSFWKEDSYRLVKLKPTDDGMALYEKEIFERIFEAAETVYVDELGSQAEQIQKVAGGKIFDFLTEKKFYKENPVTRKNKMYLWSIPVALLFFLPSSLAGVLGAVGLGMISAVMVLIPFFAVIIFISIAQRTADGREIYRGARGYKLFVSATEKHRQKFFEKENMFMTVLPYAMVFGVVDKLVNGMKVLGVVPNEKAMAAWYVGSHGFDFQSFSSEISSFASSMGSAAAPSSSGSGGGGFSGGGGGGGGGGSW